MVPVIVPRHYDQADGERALRLAREQTVEQLEQSDEEERRWYTRRFWTTVAVAVFSGLGFWGLTYLAAFAGWMLPLWTIALILFPLFTIVYASGIADAQTSSERTYRLAIQMRQELDQAAASASVAAELDAAKKEQSP